MADAGVSHSRGRRTAAWAVHAFTALGIVAGMLALIAVLHGQWKICFIWLIVATVIDGFDGMLARAVGVKQVLPGFDGALLDNVIDYVTYVIVPAMLIYARGLTPGALDETAAGIIVLSSAYQFCQADAKTADHSFTGFPSYWNVAALYLFLLDGPPWINFGILAVLGVLVFVPLKYLYPSRVAQFRRTAIAVTMVWGAALLVMVLRYPAVDPWLVWGSLSYVLFYVGMSVHAAGGLGPWLRMQ